MKRFRYTLLVIGIIVGFGLAAVPIGVNAADPVKDACTGSAAGTPLCTKQTSFDKIVGIIVNTMLYVLGAVAIIVIIVAGILYATSSGDPALITKAKNTLLYAVIGLLVAIMAYAIVNFVIDVFA